MRSAARQAWRSRVGLLSLVVALGGLPLSLAAPSASHARGHGRSVRARPAGRIQLFAEDPELGSVLSRLPQATARAAGDLRVNSWRLKRGSWNPVENPSLGDSDCVYLVLEGLLLSRVQLGSRCSAEPLGAGDLFRTDEADTHGYATVPSKRSFRVLEPARIVGLDSGLLARIDSLPGIAGHLQRRLIQRARSLNVRLAIVQVPQLATRLHLLLWHLADRWGRRCSDGAVIPFRLSHGVLAECVSAQRTSVLAAIHELQETGAIERNEDGHWLLHAEPPGEFR
jgi:CRP/FNR family transcriptional regulator, cyclic AMP receptor protein